jgi:hypothetical protein
MIAAAVAAVVLTRGPVAESVTQRSAIISFRTAAPEHSFVTLQNGARIDAGTGVDHVARLTRLTPGRRYTYTVRTGSGVLATGRFRAAPARAGRFTFAVVGDFGSGDKNETAVASLIESWHPDFVLTVGDNAYPQGSPELLDRDIFNPYAAVMRESAWFPALGNHDVKANGGQPELDAFHSLGSERWYRFTWGNAAVTVLDSDVSVGPGSPQLRFARGALALPSCFRFAAWHHPPWEEVLARAAPQHRATGGEGRRPGGVRRPPARLRPKSPAPRSVVRRRRHGRRRSGQRRRQADDPVRARRSGALRSPAGGRRRSHGAVPLPDGRRAGARRLPPRVLLTTRTD